MAQSGGLGLRASGEDPQKFILEWDGESSRHGLYGKGGNEDRLRSREVPVRSHAVPQRDVCKHRCRCLGAHVRTYVSWLCPLRAQT